MIAWNCCLLTQNMQTPLQLAVKQDSAKCLAVLLDHGTDINATDLVSVLMFLL